MAHWRINWENFLNVYVLLDALGRIGESRVSVDMYSIQIPKSSLFCVAYAGEIDLPLLSNMKFLSSHRMR